MNMTITERSAHLADYADIQAYASDANGPNGLPPIMVSPPSTTGFYAAAYRDNSTGKVVVAFRGTEPLDLNDTLGADAALKNGVWHPQFDEAINFLKDLASQEFGTEVDPLTSLRIQENSGDSVPI